MWFYFSILLAAGIRQQTCNLKKPGINPTAATSTVMNLNSSVASCSCIIIIGVIEVLFEQKAQNKKSLSPRELAI